MILLSCFDKYTHTPTCNGPRLKWPITKRFHIKKWERTMVSKVATLARKLFKIAPQKVSVFVAFANHVVMHSGSASRRKCLWMWLLALVTCDRWHTKLNTWNMTFDMLHLKHDCFSSFLPLSAQLERFSVSRMRDYILIMIM